jgi:hypothetical protein
LEYRKAIYTKLGNQTQLQDVEQEWDQIKKAITEAAHEIIQTQNKNRKTNGGTILPTGNQGKELNQKNLATA